MTMSDAAVSIDADETTSKNNKNGLQEQPQRSITKNANQIKPALQLSRSLGINPNLVDPIHLVANDILFYATSHIGVFHNAKTREQKLCQGHVSLQYLGMSNGKKRKFL